MGASFTPDSIRYADHKLNCLERRRGERWEHVALLFEHVTDALFVHLTGST